MTFFQHNVIGVIVKLCIGVMTGIQSCSHDHADISHAVRDALHHAIALEKLPEVEGIFVSDTIFIHPVRERASRDSRSSSFDENLSRALPRHIDRWSILPIDSIEIHKRSTKEQFDFLILSIRKQDRDELIIDLIKNEMYSPALDLIYVDRGRLTIIFKRRKTMWIIRDIQSYYG